MSEPIYEKVGIDNIFDTNEELDAVFWYVLYLLGGKVVIPVDEDFWNDAVPNDEDRRIVLRKEDGKLVLLAESLHWQ
jgi:hypothetical protein